MNKLATHARDRSVTPPPHLPDANDKSRLHPNSCASPPVHQPATLLVVSGNDYVSHLLRARSRWDRSQQLLCLRPEKNDQSISRNTHTDNRVLRAHELRPRAPDRERSKLVLPKKQHNE